MLCKVSALGFGCLELSVAYETFHVFGHAIINFEVSSRHGWKLGFGKRCLRLCGSHDENAASQSTPTFGRQSKNAVSGNHKFGKQRERAGQHKHGKTNECRNPEAIFTILHRSLLESISKS